MNKIFTKPSLLLLLLVLFTKSFQAQTTFTDAVSYNDYIVDNQDKIGVELLKFMDLFADGASEERFKEVHLVVLLKIEEAIKATKAMPAYDGNLRLKDASVNLFSFYKSVVEKEYKELMDIYIAGVFNEETSKQMELLIASISQREEAFDKEFATAQEEFSKKHNFSLEENQLQKEFENDGE